MTCGVCSAMNMTAIKRRHLRKSEKEEVLARWRASGQSMQAFARQAGIAQSSLWRWRRELDARHTPAFVPVVVRSEPANAQPPAAAARTAPVVALELRWPSGCRARIYRGFSRTELETLLASMAEVYPC